MAYEPIPGKLTGSSTYDFARTSANELVNTSGLSMAGVFMFSTCMIALRVGHF